MGINLTIIIAVIMVVEEIILTAITQIRHNKPEG